MDGSNLLVYILFAYDLDSACVEQHVSSLKKRPNPTGCFRRVLPARHGQIWSFWFMSF